MNSRIAKYWFWLGLKNSLSTIGAIALINTSVLAQPSPEADRYLESAQFQLQSGSLLAAQNSYQQALRLYQAANNLAGQQNCSIGLAQVNYQEANYTQALEQLRQAERLLPGERNGLLMSTRGLIYIELGNYREAANDLRWGVHHLRVTDRDRIHLNRAEIGLGEAYLYLGQYQQGLNTLQSLVNRTFDLHLRRRAFNAIGTIQLELAQNEAALTSFEQAASVPNISGDRIGKAKTLENLGRVNHALGKRQVALKYYQKALGELRSIGAWEQQVFVLNRLGQLAGSLGLKNRALEYLQQALGTVSSSGGVGRVLTLVNLGNFYQQQGDLVKAQEYLESALAWARSNGDRIGETKALSGLGIIQMRSENRTAAIAHLESSIEIFEDLRPGLRDEDKISLFDTQLRTYSLLQQAYVDNQQSDRALIVAERSRARAFIELLAQRLAASEQEDPTNPLDISKITAVARERQATLVTYSIVTDEREKESKLYIWVVNPEGKITFRQLNLAQLRSQLAISLASIAADSRQTAGGGPDTEKALIEDFVVAMRGNEPKKIAPKIATQNGYKLLIEPIADLLPIDPQAKIIFIPQGALFLVPFAALQDSTGKYLIEQHTIQIAPSIQTLTLKKPVNSNNQALIIGNPAPMPETLAALPGTKIEANTIATMFNVPPILEGEATETKVTESIEQASIIHFATHGLFNEKQPLQSSLALAASDGDGFLTADDILNYKLQADLVFLSACNTGRGKITGDGAIGLSRSFLAAGAQSTVVSLWYVPDLPTATLAIEFYRHLQATQDKAQALRQAMLTVMKQNPHPVNWAGFMLVGY
jgi:CHAT domain-containing protein/Tfp pilus assembly protein PilF